MDTDDQFKITCRLIIKNIPENISDEHFQNILNDNFSKHIKEQPLMIKLSKKYAPKKKNKICFFTVDGLDARSKIADFFSSFELIDPKGMKQKLVVNDCLLQTRIKTNTDAIENSIEDCEHFMKFKEAFADEKIVDFKTKEEEYCSSLFDGIENMIVPSKGKEDDITITTSAGAGTTLSLAATEQSKQKGKMVIMKKTNENTPIKAQENFQYEIQEGGQKEDQLQAQESPSETLQSKPQDSNCEIEIIQESSNKHFKNNARGQKNKTNYSDNYYNNDGYYYGNNNNGGVNKKAHQKNSNGGGGGYYDNGYYYDNNNSNNNNNSNSGSNGNGGNNKQAYRKGGYKKGYK